MTELGYVYESKDGRLWSYRECAEAADRGASGAETRALNDLLCAQDPRHLSWKTPRDNALDRRAAGTLTKRRWNRYGLVSHEEMAEIIALRGQKNQREIATMFGISPQHVSTIQLGRLRKQGSFSSHKHGSEP
jgi:hypothetical protein